MKLKKIKLNQIADTMLNEREMLRLFGTGTSGKCGCSCLYADKGGSCSSDNHSANCELGITSPGYGECDEYEYEYEYECPPPPPPLTNIVMCGFRQLHSGCDPQT